MSETDPPTEATEATITCRNCGSSDVQQWCPNCGQENVPSAMPIREILFGFLDELLKFDAKIWITLKLLITRPGLLTNEYLMGHRVRYVAPVKLYLAISFVTFFIVALLPQERSEEKKVSQGFNTGLTLAQGIIPGSMAAKSSSAKAEKSEEDKGTDDALLATLTGETKQNPGESDEDFKKRIAATKKHADACLDVAVKVARSEASVREQVRLRTQREARRDAWISGNQTTLSLLSVPLYALLLAYLLRKDTKRLYVEHLIFALHYQCLAQLSTTAAAALAPMPLIGWLALLVSVFGPPIYFVFAARSVYKLPGKRMVLILIGFVLLSFIVVMIKDFTAGIIFQLFG